MYFTVRLQNYTAIEKDEVLLSCELSKATGDVKWFKDGEEVFPSKNILIQSDGKKRMMVIKKAARSSAGTYTCSCGTDKTTCDLNIEGNLLRPAAARCRGRPPHLHPPSIAVSPAFDLHMWQQSPGFWRPNETRGEPARVSGLSDILCSRSYM